MPAGLGRGPLCSRRLIGLNFSLNGGRSPGVEHCTKGNLPAMGRVGHQERSVGRRNKFSRKTSGAPERGLWAPKAQRPWDEGSPFPIGVSIPLESSGRRGCRARFDCLGVGPLESTVGRREMVAVDVPNPGSKVPRCVAKKVAVRSALETARARAAESSSRSRHGCGNETGSDRMSQRTSAPSKGGLGASAL